MGEKNCVGVPLINMDIDEVVTHYMMRVMRFGGILEYCNVV